MSTPEDIPKRRRRASPAPADVHNPAYRTYSFEERAFYRGLPNAQRLAIANAEVAAAAAAVDVVPRRFQLLLSDMSDTVRAAALRKLELLDELESSSGEYAKISTWMDRVCKLPLGKYRSLPVTHRSTPTEMRDFILGTRKHLDDKIYGHKQAKEHIVRLLAQWVMKPEAKGLVLGIHGAPGTAKTSLIKNAICQVLDLPFAFVALGGMCDGSDLVGHGYTYEGSMPGKIVDVLTRAQCCNPVICFDELDKVSSRRGGDEIIHTLMHVTDSTQNTLFQDRYFAGDFTFDLSRCLLVFTFNDETLVNPILLDRMVRIRADGYTVKDKVSIATGFLLPEILADHNFKPTDVVIPEEVIKQIISRVDQEDGVRNLKRGLVDVVSHLNLERVVNVGELSLPHTVTEKDVVKYVHVGKADKHANMGIYT
jgi:ATP-dependent Lon protease